MTQIRLRATKDHPTLAEGTVYEAAPVFAASDLYRKFALEAPGEELAHVQTPTAVEDAEPQRNKRNYKRRDMQAE